MVDIYSSPNFETEFKPEVIERGNKVKLVIADVDGVLTDGSIYKAIDPATLADIEFKNFSIVDGAGIALARLLDFRVAIISGRPSLATDARVKELKIEDVYTGSLNKMTPYEDL